MSRLFGIPIGPLAVALVDGVAVCARRDRRARPAQPRLLPPRVRNVARRRGRTALIVVGLMLGTAIIAAALRPATR